MEELGRTLYSPPMIVSAPVSSAACPVCGTAGMIPTVQRAVLPAMQNYVFSDRTAALSSPSGRFELGVCKTCGFAGNVAFDASIPTYDQRYDNAVPSAVFKRYYREIADHLYAHHSLSGGLVVDVGCGKGEFLAGLCEAYPDVRGLGVDPSCQPKVTLDGRMRLISDIFRPGLIEERPALVVCRHVVEHIGDPVAFLTSVRIALAEYPGVPVFVEVPDLNWIIDARAFWDFCYEHCNYFTEGSMAEALARAGFRLDASSKAFGGQYLWFECINEPPLERVKLEPSLSMARDLVAYAEAEAALVADMVGLIDRLKAEENEVVVWGMATKGVMFSALVDPGGDRIDWCVDVNPSKQGTFAPLSGRRIDAPEMLKTVASRQIAILIMNDNYADEIKQQCRAMSLGVPPRFMDAAGRPI